MCSENDAVILIKRILSGNMSPQIGNELPQVDDSVLIDSVKEIAMKLIEANSFVNEIATGNICCNAPKNNKLVDSTMELQSILKHLIWNVECIAKEDFNQGAALLGDFSEKFNRFINQVKLKEDEERNNSKIEKAKLNNQNEMLDNLLNYQLEHYKKLTKVHKLVQGIRHDIKNHCFILNEFLNQGDIKKTQDYLAQISSQMMTTQESIYCTGNAVFDALITEKISKAKQKGINVDVKLAIGEREINVSNLDWCIILGNALDNAIEACQRLVSGEPHIWIEARVRKNIFNLIIKNTAQQPKIKKDGHYYTSKSKNGNHGLGLANIESVVERHNGVMQTQFSEGNFIIGIMLCGV